MITPFHEVASNMIPLLVSLWIEILVGLILVDQMDNTSSHITRPSA
jgi:hypothetical protein